jgi:hypothetical protein
MNEGSRQAAKRLSLLVGVVAGLGACGKSTAPSARSTSASASVLATAPAAGEEDVSRPMDARESAQWAQAKEGDPEELMRLADLVGCEGLRERASQPELQMTALRAAAYCVDFTELPWLARVATEGRDDEARAALEAAVDLAARPRHATDPDDAEELHAGCGALLALARSNAPKERRALAIRALRMLSERGCAKRSDIPTDLDVH